MDFFEPQVNERKQHHNFKNILIPERECERRIFNSWAKGFVDRDKKLIKEFQTTFNSSFWEVYLFQVFKDLELTVDWSKATPDFSVSSQENEFIVEATTANAANGKPNEWDKKFDAEEIAKTKRFAEINREAIIRLSNAFLYKSKKYLESYSKIEHVKGKPFVLAIAPFEQPYFNLQYNRPISALLYNQYVNEDVYLDNPEEYPNGPPTEFLDFVEKDNGAEIPLGFFANNDFEHISAVIFSSTATWGKLSAMGIDFGSDVEVGSVWSHTADGIPVKHLYSNQEHNERAVDGLQIYHNPFATNPLPFELFNKKGIVQSYYDPEYGNITRYGLDHALYFRTVTRITRKIL
ncbi:hypothetical protein GNP81_16320 [Aliivibrio fischeri]|uniref:hypothetical protein n=1 Tax=Aliivibrio fischeri TaxID=668 RepID=UPI0012D91008|nr:hypothetical protein [Aliivibrio fischeri]MUK62728.1 hypothetical protein [Aliivibrio fischeri]MUL22372.1 hypothetical protein [Aliivibrio fischeri]MUL26163.1 hypothetical protein [Aliivibrio fischeri]